MKIIIVSSEFPPSLVANARRPALLAREMLARGHSVEVITRDPEGPERCSEWSDEPGLIVHRLPDPVAGWRRRWDRYRLVRGLLKRLWPDRQILWVIRAALRLRKMNDSATVVACINPESMLLLRWLVPSRGLYFVFDYLESVTPFRRHVQYDITPHRQLRGIMFRIERATLRRADQVVFSCSENRSAYISEQLCNAEDSRYIPFCCDPNPHAEEDLPCDGSMVISYTGYFNRDRSPEVILKGLRAFLDAEPAAAKHVVLNCYGNGLGLHQHLASDLKLEGIVNDCGTVKHEEMIRICAESHLLLLVASSKHRLFFPSKVVEYVAARRPVLALIPTELELAAMLRRCGHSDWICPEADVSAVAGRLRKTWHLFQSGDLGKRLPISEEVMPGRFVERWEESLNVSRPTRAESVKRSSPSRILTEEQ